MLDHCRELSPFWGVSETNYYICLHYYISIITTLFIGFYDPMLSPHSWDLGRSCLHLRHPAAPCSSAGPFSNEPGDHGATAAGADGPGRRPWLRGTLRGPRRCATEPGPGLGPGGSGAAGRWLGTLGQLGAQGVGSQGYGLERVSFQV